MNRSDVLNALDSLIRSRSILSHPFYRAWQRGELTREQLATYARVYYPHVAAFPGYLAMTTANTSDPVVVADLERNLADELGSPAPHTELWLDFAEEVGLDRETVANAPAHPAAQQAIDTFQRLATQGTASGLAALYAYESQQPEVSAEKRGGLQEHYGVKTPKALQYFDVHAELDLHHRAGELESLGRVIDAGVPATVVLEAANDALDAYWKLLDGVCEECGISMVC